jgi:hypothetical protein
MVKTEKRKPHLNFRKVWEDNDMSEIVIRAHDEDNTFVIRVYAGHEQIKEVFAQLDAFKKQIHGGIIDVTFGSFGPEYAYGAFLGRFHFASDQRGLILISLRMQSTYFDFGRKNVASEAEMYLTTEPALLDDFIRSFSHLDEGNNTESELECVERS